MKHFLGISAYILLAFLVVLPAVAESNFAGDRLKSAMITYVNKLINPERTKDIEIIFNKEVRDYKFSQDGINAKFNVNEKALFGSTNIAIEFYNNGLLVERDEFPIRIKIYEYVPVATRRINRGAVIGAEDISMAKKDVSVYRNVSFPSAEEIIGLSANQNIQENAVISSNKLSYASSEGIKRGDAVNVIARSGGVSVSVKGVAMNDATLGNRIRVKCESSSKSSAQIVEGIVENSNTVVINK